MAEYFGNDRGEIVYGSKEKTGRSDIVDII